MADDGAANGESTGVEAGQPSEDSTTEGAVGQEPKKLPDTTNDKITISDGGTYQLTQDVSADIVIDNNAVVTIDLNGKKLTNHSADTLTVKLGSTLTVMGSGTVDNVTHGKAAVYNNGTVVLKGGVYTRSKENGVSAENNGGNSYYNILNHGVMTIYDGVEVSQNGNFSSLISNGYYNYSNGNNERSNYVKGTNQEAPSLTIKGGSFSGGINTIKNDDGSILNISGGKFTNYTQAAFQNHGTATVSGGEFSAESKYSIDNCGCEATHDPGKLTVTGGTFTGTLLVRSKFSNVTISGGTFNGSIEKTGGSLSGSLSISGGTFSTDVSAYMVKDASYEYKMNDGNFVVQAKDAAAPANSAGFNSWAAADENGVRTEQYIAPVIPTPTPKPEPTPAAPGTAVSGTDNAGNKVDATVTDNTATTLPDGTTAAGSVEYKPAENTGSAGPATEVSVPSSVTTSDGSTYIVTKIADSAFEGQEQLTKVTIPETVVEIGDKAFAGTSIEEVKIPAATTTIGAGAFKDCESLKTADISASAITEVPADAFNGSTLASVEIPSTVTTIGARAFKDTDLKVVASDATSVSQSAFADCESLKTVSLPKAAVIGKYAFKDAAKLKTLTTGKKLEAIGYKALAGTKVKTLTISSKKLSQKSVKGSLKGSNVSKVVVDVTGSKKTVAKTVAKYQKYFKKTNSGKSVKVVAKKK